MATNQTAPDQDPADEAWIRSADGDTAVRIRNLTRHLERGGKVMDARMHEDEQGHFSIFIRLDDRPGEIRVNQYREDVAKTWVDANLAIATLRDEFAYFGGIMLTTDRRAVAKAG